MSTETKHTPGQLRAVGSDPDTDIAPVIVDRDGNPVAEVPIYYDNSNGHSQGTALAVSNAERLALAWNCHDPLVAALEECAAAHASVESCDMPAWLDSIEAALALTRDH